MTIKIDKDFYQLYLKLDCLLEDAPVEDPAFIVARLTVEEVKLVMFAIKQFEAFYFAASKLEEHLEKRREEDK